jgi:general L-amino acid transport system permease protein
MSGPSPSKKSAGDLSSRPRLWNDPVVRAIFFQSIAAVLLVWFFWTIFDNTLTNMENRGIKTGFGFLDDTAGFGILMSLIPYIESNSYGRTFVVGLLNTLLVSGLGIFFATILGFVVGIARLSNNWLIAKIASVYVEMLRNIPLLLQILFWYALVLLSFPAVRDSFRIGDAVFISNGGVMIPSPVPGDGFNIVIAAFAVAIIAVWFMARWARRRFEATGRPFHSVSVGIAIIVGLPLIAFIATGLPLSFDYPVLGRFRFSGGTQIIPELFSLLLALSMYTAAFIAEIVRAGILSVSYGQTEAARALGLKTGPTLRLVIIPQAMRVIIPPLTSQYLNLTKNSSLATAIGYPDLVSVFAGTTLNQTGQAVEIIAMTMAVYLMISLTISCVMNWYNRRMALVER